MRWLATDTDLWTDDTWIVDSTPVECGRSLPAVKRSELAGGAWPSPPPSGTTAPPANPAPDP